MAKSDQRGFSLLELSIVLVVIGTLASSMVIPLIGSMKQARIKQTAAQLSHIRKALLGFMVSNGRLPCPINLGFVEQDRNTGSQPCATQHGGVPAAKLGVMGEQSLDGALLDAWGRPYHYSVSFSDHQDNGLPGAQDWLSVGELAAVGASNLKADLQLCRSVANNSCASKELIANQIVWVVLSKGEADESSGLQSENTDNDKVFVHSAYSSNKDQAFDDQLIWASQSELIYWLLKANWLP